VENILFYTDAYSTRLRYIVDFLLCNLLGINPLYANNPSQLSQSTLPKIIYSGMETFSAVSAQATGVWLHRRHPILTEKGVNCHYSTDFADDLLAHAFFELSRYEEYAAEQRDTHGRFTSAQSLAYKKGYLQRPIVHEIAAVLMQKLSQHYPNLRFQTPTYSFQPTYDIDMAWKYAHKGAFRICANLCRDALTLDYQAIWTKFQVYLGHRADPDFVFSYMERIHEVFGLTPIYFWLLGDYGKFDKNISFDNKIFQTLICKIAQQYPVGIHPSYASNQSVELLMKEIARLRQLTGRPVLMSRQHFLKLNLPSTYWGFEQITRWVMRIILDFEQVFRYHLIGMILKMNVLQI
jgi:hypothetical protein